MVGVDIFRRHFTFFASCLLTFHAFASGLASFFYPITSQKFLLLT